MQIRRVEIEEAVRLAPLNHQLIIDEGHRNSMTLDGLTDRMKNWLSDGYVAIVAEDSKAILGYALYRLEPEYIYVRQLFILQQRRREGIGRAIIDFLMSNHLSSKPRIRIEVLSQNVAAQKFWRSIGFVDYAITMELEESLVNKHLQSDALSSRV